MYQFSVYHHQIFVVCLSVQNGNGCVYFLKLLQLGPQRVARYKRHAIVGACHCTSDGQNTKIIQRVGPERDTIFHLRVTACRERGSHCRDERLAWVTSRWQGTSCSCSFVSKVLGANCKRANNFLPVADKFAMCTFEPTSNAHACVDYKFCHHAYVL